MANDRMLLRDRVTGETTVIASLRAFGSHWTLPRAQGRDHHPFPESLEVFLAGLGDDPSRVELIFESDTPEEIRREG